MIERALVIQILQRIPCELTVLTYDGGRDGSAYLGCKECTRCRILNLLRGDRPITEIHEELLARRVNGGYELRKDLRK